MAQSTNSQEQHRRNKTQGSETNDELQPQESGKEGSSCHYYSAPSPCMSFSLIPPTQFFYPRERGEKKKRKRGRERGGAV